ncbi:hypothetical protein EG328_006021 [Venturia inaequalis]|uniref:Uncharacterized protein n=1 Tax=Venturia inaequalis TaxID=5025 RepID=A0A8H3Z537_VENIN|nr:hypothetical protein EG328_006021 [Venturia inaequalis]
MAASHLGLHLTRNSNQHRLPIAPTSPPKGKLFWQRYVEEYDKSHLKWFPLGTKNAHMVIVFTNPNGNGHVLACTITTKCHAQGLQFFPISPNPQQNWPHQIRLKHGMQLKTKHWDRSYMRGQPFKLPAHMLVPMVEDGVALEMEEDCMRQLQGDPTRGNHDNAGDSVASGSTDKDMLAYLNVNNCPFIKTAHFVVVVEGRDKNGRRNAMVRAESVHEAALYRPHVRSGRHFASIMHQHLLESPHIPQNRVSMRIGASEWPRTRRGLGPHALAWNLHSSAFDLLWATLPTLYGRQLYLAWTVPG